MSDDFDWVTARARCSLTVMFDRLANVATRNAEAAPAHARFVFLRELGEPRFQVVRRDASGEQYVQFTRKDSFMLVFRSATPGEGHNRVHLTLTDSGQCRWIIVRGEELSRPLEDLFFNV